MCIGKLSIYQKGRAEEPAATESPGRIVHHPCSLCLLGPGWVLGAEVLAAQVRSVDTGQAAYAFCCQKMMTC
eukprot:1158291-Pelagomonas_calceolata.AAC.4